MYGRSFRRIGNNSLWALISYSMVLLISIVNSISRKLECPVCRHHIQKDKIILITSFNIRKCETGIFSQIFPSINNEDIKNSRVLFVELIKDKISELIIKIEGLDSLLKETKRNEENLTLQNKELKDNMKELIQKKENLEKGLEEEMQAKKECE